MLVWPLFAEQGAISRHHGNFLRVDFNLCHLTHGLSIGPLNPKLDCVGFFSAQLTDSCEVKFTFQPRYEIIQHEVSAGRIRNINAFKCSVA